MKKSRGGEALSRSHVGMRDALHASDPWPATRLCHATRHLSPCLAHLLRDYGHVTGACLERASERALARGDLCAKTTRLGAGELPENRRLARLCEGGSVLIVSGGRWIFNVLVAV
ncbi:hypothetical protein AAFF_G00244960 [Aldrovandia affinis]|uniref:Uncharacterized protein n=1 Tax=Aldrovandia affinis TaxID=143900 RepID=A0AAD7RDN0_9TELE|nr:hypothetical protein AAFF_G00244960 [Aldrovandia affinis]